MNKVMPKVWCTCTPHRLAFRNTARPAFGPSCTEFVYPECWHFDNDATSKIDDVLTEHGGLLHVLTLAVHLRFLCLTCRGDHSEPFLLFEVYCGIPPSCLKVMGWWGGVVWWLGGWPMRFQCQQQSQFGNWD